jgi:hypothetical protein
MYVQVIVIECEEYLSHRLIHHAALSSHLQYSTNEKSGQTSSFGSLEFFH